MPITRRAALAAPILAAIAPKQARAAETIKIGQITPSTGPNAENGRFMLNGARLAVDVVNAAGGVLGRKLELVTEDDQSTNPGAILAFSRLASQSDIVAFLGPTSSTQMHAIAADALKAGKPVTFHTSDPALTHTGNGWLFRVRAHDGYSAGVMAEYGLKELGKQKWAVVHSTDAFGTAAMKLLVDALDKAGIKPLLVQGYVNWQVDFTAVALAVKQAGADIVGSYMTFPNDCAVFARQMRQLGVAVTWVGSQSITAGTTLSLAGSALNGTYGVVDFAPDSSPEATAFATRYQQTYGRPADAFTAWPYDEVTILANAINAAGGTDPEPLRKALLGIRGLRGVNGTFNFDANGDGLRGLNIVRNDGGKVVFIRHVEFGE